MGYDLLSQLASTLKRVPLSLKKEHGIFIAVYKSKTKKAKIKCSFFEKIVDGVTLRILTYKC